MRIGELFLESVRVEGRIYLIPSLPSNQSVFSSLFICRTIGEISQWKGDNSIEKANLEVNNRSEVV